MSVRVPEKHDPERQAGQGQGAAQAGIEYRDERVRCQAGGPQPDPSAHHNGHYDIGFQIEKMSEGAGVLLVASDPPAVFFAHSEEHEPEKTENSGRKQYVHKRN